MKHLNLVLLGIGVIIAWVFLPVETEKEELAKLTSPESEYHREIRRNGYIIRVNYLPLRYFELRHLVALGEHASDDAKNQAIQEASTQYGNGLYFMITLAHEDKNRDVEYERIGNFRDYSVQLQKFLFQMDEYVTLETAKDSDIKLSVYDFERTYGYTKHRKMLVCFPKEFNGTEILSEESEFVRMEFKEFGFGIGKQSVEWDVGELRM
jgi:hypothetical protein